MKSVFLILTLGACSLFSPKEDQKPVVREAFHKCPDSEVCAGKFRAGGICMPSGEHHSVPEKCDIVK
jgi:hypothetical protein